MTGTDADTRLTQDPGAKGLILATLALLAVGAVAVPSALDSVSAGGPWYSRTSVRHVVFVVLAAGIVLTAWRFDYRVLARGRRLPVLAAVLLGASIICSLLVFVPGVGKSVGSYHRWIRLGSPKYAVGFQPSEMVKLSLVIFLAAWLSRKSDKEVRSFRGSFLPAAVLAGICILLVVTQDMGTAVVIALAAGVTMLLAGVRWQFLAGLAGWCAGGFYAFLASSPSRWLRIEAMLDPMSADNPSTYQLRQSLQAVVTGGWAGRGAGLGMMKRGFLPEDSTDFLFAIICEEWGFIGAVGLIGILIVWLILARRAACRAGDKFGQVLAGSLAFLISLQAAMHIAVNLGCLPPTGIAMPFVSAGGTSLILLGLAAAAIVSVSVRGRETDAQTVFEAPSATAI